MTSGFGISFSTSTDVGSVWLSKSGENVDGVLWRKKSTGAELLTGRIQSLLKKNKVKIKDLRWVGVDRGPGSFTGCRISVNVAKTFAYALNIPVIPVSSLDLMAYPVYENLEKQGFEGLLLSVLDAHRSLFYFTKYRCSRGHVFAPLGAPKTTNLEGLSEETKTSTRVFVAGVPREENQSLLREKFLGLDKGREILFAKPANLNFPSGKAFVGWIKTQKEPFSIPWINLEPTYVRAPDAVERLNLSKSL